MIPFAVWFKLLYFPNRQEREARSRMHAKRRERIDEQARVTRENLRLAKIEDEKREAAARVRSLLVSVCSKHSPV